MESFYFSSSEFTIALFINGIVLNLSCPVINPILLTSEFIIALVIYHTKWCPQSFMLFLLYFGLLDWNEHWWMYFMTYRYGIEVCKLTHAPQQNILRQTHVICLPPNTSLYLSTQWMHVIFLILLGINSKLWIEWCTLVVMAWKRK